MAMSGELREEIQSLAAEVRKRVYGGDGIPEWGVKFCQIEADACEIGDALAAAFMEQAVARQAEVPPSAAGTCSKCGQPTQTDPNDPLEPRSLETSRGSVGWQEPKGYCRQCRQAFFPSEPRPGPGRDGHDEPEGAGESDLCRRA